MPQDLYGSKSAHHNIGDSNKLASYEVVLSEVDQGVTVKIIHIAPRYGIYFSLKTGDQTALAYPGKPAALPVNHKVPRSLLLAWYLQA